MSNTSLYTSQGGNVTVPPNNNTGLYNTGSQNIPINTDINTVGNISAQGNITGGNLISQGDISAVGNIYADNFVGNVVGNLVVAGSNTQVIYNNNGVAGASAAFTFDQATNVVAVGGAVTATGNITGNYFFGNGSQLTGITANYSNANVTALLANLGTNSISGTGNVTASFFFGDGSQLTNLPAGNYSNANVAAYLPTYTGALSGNAVSVTGNVTGAFILGDGSQLTNLPAGNYSNANVVSLLAAFGSNTLSTTGTVTAGQLAGNGNGISNIQAANISGTVTSASIANLVTVSNANALSSSTQYVTFASAPGNTQINIDNGATTPMTYVPSSSTLGITNLNANGNVLANGVVSATGNVTGGNIRTAGQVTATGNITGNFFIGNGSQLTGITTNYSNANVTALMAAFGSNSISTTGNVTAGYFLGDGSQLTNLPLGNYSNANVAAYLPVYTGNIAAGNVSATGNVTANVLKTSGATGNIVGANWVSANFYLGDGGYLSNIQVGNVVGAYSNANVANYLPTFSGNLAGGNLVLTANTGNAYVHDVTATGSALITGVVSAAGNVRGGNINTAGIVTATGGLFTADGVSAVANIVGGNIRTAGVVTATGNITGNYFIGNGSQLTGLPAGYSNADVNAHLAAFGSNTISTTGNITAGYFAGNGSLLSNIAGANVTGTVANATFATSSGTAATVTGNAQANITSVGTLTSLSVTGTVTAGNVSTTGNITAGYFLGNGSQLTNIPAGGSNTQIQFNDGGVFAGNANVTYDKATGNVTLGNLVMNGNIILNVNSWQSNTDPNPGRVIIGTGQLGNYSGQGAGGNNGVAARLLVTDQYIRYDNGIRMIGLTIQNWANLAGGNVGSANANSRTAAISQDLYLMNGNIVSNNLYAHRAQSAALNLGFANNTSNVFVQSSTVGSFFATVFTGSTANTLVQVAAGSQLFGNVANLTGFTWNSLGTANVTSNAYCIYNPGSTTSIGGQSNFAGVRSAPNYYFLRNDDDLAKNKLGSLELFHYNNANTANTTGTLTINKNNGQYQTIYPTGNITIGSFTNFVTRVAQPNGTQNNQADVVTLLIQQPATPWTVTMPTGNTNIRYANSSATVANTANSTTKITVTATYNYNVGANQYLINIDPEYITV